MPVKSAATIAVIGAGPAGCMAALEAAAHGAQVTLYDSNDQVGRKLLVTGNGRCNISHVGASAGDYTTDAPDALEHILTRCGHDEIARHLEAMGVLIYATPDGWCYPWSDSAATVAQAFAAALEIAGVRVRLGALVRGLRPRAGGWSITAGDPGAPEQYSQVIVAAGGKAHPALGSTGQCYTILERLGHTVLPVHPALVSIEADMRSLDRLQGVRLDAELSLFAGDACLGRDTGNLMFTQSGLSGPAAMNLSHLVRTAEHQPLTARIDLLALHNEALQRLLEARRGQPWPVAVLLGAVLPAKIPPVLLSMARLAADARLNRLSEAQLDQLLRTARGISVRVTGTRGFAFAQLSTGGVPLAEVDAETMESLRTPGLFLAGEVLNVIGPCGGYNLLFAQASGVIAGQGAAQASVH